MFRNSLRRPLAVAVLATVAMAGGTTAYGAQGWSQGGFNSARTGYNTTEKVLSPKAVKHLKTAWHDDATGSIAAHGKRVYAARPGGIYALKAANGHRLKKYHVGDKYATPGAPIIGHKVLYTTLGSTLMSLKLSNGKRVWSVKEHDKGAVSHQWSNVTVDGGTLVAILTTSNSSLETSTTRLEAISATTGKVLWSKANYFGPLAAAYGAVYAQANGKNVGPGSYNHTISALSLADGSALWAAPTEFATIQFVYHVTVTPTMLLVGCGSSVYGAEIYGLSPTTGAISWQYNDPKTDEAPSGGPMVTDGTTVAYLSGNNNVVALRVATGAFVWRKRGSGNAVGADGVVYVTDSSTEKYGGRDIAYALSNGKTLWRGPTTYTMPTMVAAGHLFTQDSQAGFGGTGALYVYGA